MSLIAALLIELVKDEAEQLLGLQMMMTDAMRGTELMKQLREGHLERIYNLTRLRKETFKGLLAWIQERGIIKEGSEVTVAEKLLIFLFIYTYNTVF